MISLLRQIHLYSGLVFFIFILMYFISGYVMIRHIIWENRDPEKNVRTEAVNYPLNLDNEGVSEYLQRQFGINGKRLPSQQMKDGRWKFSYAHPGYINEAFVSSDRDSVEIVSRKWGARGIIVQYHRLFGYEGGWLYSVWAFLLDLTSLTMIVFPLSGIIMWYKLTKRRLFGWILLSLSFGFAGFTILYFIYAP